MNLAVLLGLLALAVFVLAMRGPQVDHLRWRRAHHFYLGVVLLALGVYLHWTWLAWLGAALMVDDAVQHAFQRWWKPSSRISLVHLVILPALWRIPAYRKLSAWWDSLFA